MIVFFWIWTIILAVLLVAFLVMTILMFGPGGLMRGPTAPERQIEDDHSSSE